MDEYVFPYHEPTVRQRQVLDEITKPHATYAEVAEHLGITTETVRSHVGNLYNRLGVNSMAQAYRMVMERDAH